LSGQIPELENTPGSLKSLAYACPYDLSEIESALKTREIGRAPAFPNELWQAIDSTNTRAMELAKQGAPHGLFVIARQQTSGRGRLGRSWISPMDAGLYLSFLLRPDKFRPNIPLVTLATGYACAKAINILLGIKVGIKWVNDLVLSGRKLGGILSELYLPPDLNQASAASAEALIVGIGINIEGNAQEVPEEIRAQMAWLTEVVPTGFDRNKLVAQIAFELEQAIDALSAGAIDEILNGWRYYAVTLGESVVATIGNETHAGVAIDVDTSGALILKTKDGTRTLHAGEVTLRRPDGTYA
jgi:BirA family transcriptional regulator, biotin operon repressor / biotin---[acetyl-CoA-carboxylase] ligase